MSVLQIKANSLKIFDDPVSESVEFLLPDGVHVQMQTPNVSGVIARSVNNVPADASGNINITTSVGGSGSAAVLATIAELEGYTGDEIIVTVTDPKRGGTFTKAVAGRAGGGSSYTVNNGTIFAAAGGGFWLRKIEIIDEANVQWWGATGLQDQDCTDIFRAAFAYCQDYFVFEGGTPGPPYIRRTLYIPSGDYRWTSQIIIGGKPISETDSLTYQYTSLDAPSRNTLEMQKVANTVPFSIRGGERVFIHGDYVPTELTAMLVYGSAPYQIGFYDTGGVIIENLTFVSRLGLFNGPVATGTNQQGLQVFGMWHCEYRNINHVNFEVCEQYNTCYGLRRTLGIYRNSQLGMNTMGSHSMTGGNLWTDHCTLGYKFDGGACVWNQINSEQCLRAVLITGGNITISGVYLEQLDPTSGPNDYQIHVVGAVGFQLDGGVISPNNGKGVKVENEGAYVSFKSVNAGGGTLDVVSPNTDIYIENCNFYWNNIGRHYRPLSDNFSIPAGTINNLTSQNATLNNLTASNAVNTNNLNAAGEIQLSVGHGGIEEKHNKKILNLAEAPDIILTLGKIGDLVKGDSVIGRVTLLGNQNPGLIRGGFIDINFSNKFSYAGYNFSAVINNASYNVTVEAVTYTYAGEQYLGIRFTGPTQGWNYARGYFEGVYGGGAWVLGNINALSVTGITPAVATGGTTFKILSETISIPGLPRKKDRAYKNDAEAAAGGVAIDDYYNTEDGFLKRRIK